MQRRENDKMRAAWDQGLEVLGASDEQLEHGLALHADLLPCDTFGYLPSVFGAPDGLAENLLFILHWDEETSQWAEIPINETTAAQVTALSDNGGFFVLAKMAEENGESVQSQLSGVTGQPAILQVGQNQVTISGAAGDLITITNCCSKDINRLLCIHNGK